MGNVAPAQWWSLVENGEISDTPLAQAYQAEQAFRLDEAEAALVKAYAPDMDPVWARVHRLIELRLAFRRAKPERLGSLSGEIEEAISMIPDVEETATLARAYHLLGVVHIRQNNFEHAERALLHALSGTEDSPCRWWILDGLGQVCAGQGAWSEARRIFMAVGRWKQSVDDYLGRAITLGNLALLELGLGRPKSAASLCRLVLNANADALEPISQLRLQTMIVQAGLDAQDRADNDGSKLRALLEQTGERRHYLKGFASLALARLAHAESDLEQTRTWLDRASKELATPDQKALARYWRIRLGIEQAAPDVWLADMEELFREVGTSTEAELLTYLHLAESSAGEDRLRFLDSALETAAAANNRLWMERVDHLFQQLDPHRFGRRVIERFSGRKAEELEQTVEEDATIVFADLAGFTARSQELSPDEVMETVRSLFELAVPLLTRYKVQPLQHLGDGLLAVSQGDSHSGRGRDFARELVRRTRRASDVRTAIGDGWGLTVRAGVASGPVVLGLLGSHYKMEYLAIGRTTNLAARLQGQAEPGEVMCSVAAAGGEHGQEELLKLKGFPDPVPAIRLS